MQILKRLWSLILTHGLIFLGSAVVFLIRPEGTSENRLAILAVLLLVAAVIQGIILWQKKGSGVSWIPSFLVIAADLTLGGLILYAPEESLRIYIIILALWSALMGLVLLLNFGVKKPFKASMTAAGITFFILGAYISMHISNPENLNIQLLGILSLIFAIYLIYVALQLRFQKSEKIIPAETEPSEEEEDSIKKEEE